MLVYVAFGVIFYYDLNSAVIRHSSAETGVPPCSVPLSALSVHEQLQNLGMIST
jgi:hypothetical protein